jgi:hypothetical protein
MHYFKRLWNESRGDEHDRWGSSTWYLETDDEYWVSRQIEVYADGTVLQYDRQHLDDHYGGLSEKPIDAGDFAPFVITKVEFEDVWSRFRPMNRRPDASIDLPSQG